MNKEDFIRQAFPVNCRWEDNLDNCPIRYVEIALDEWAKTESIAFAEWLTTKDSPYSPIYGETERWCDSDKEYTTAQLYEQFKQQKS